MHTARQLSADMFKVTMRGLPASPADLIPNWGPLDRIGIVAHSPYALFGASHLVQLAIAMFYDVRPTRREGTLQPGEQNPKVIYPEQYLFHVGGPWGDVSAMDFWPSRKEVFLPNDPRVVLDAINDRGITRLLVPDGTPRNVEHVWTEPAAARDRIQSVFLYDPSGRITDPDVSIGANDPAAQQNIGFVLDTVANVRRVGALGPETYADEDLRKRSWAFLASQRVDERLADREAAELQRHALVDNDGWVRETYRVIDVDQALSHLAW